VKSVVIGKENTGQTCVPTCLAKNSRGWGPMETILQAVSGV